MEPKCCFSGCLDKPLYICICNRAEIYCQNHRINHDNNPFIRHEWEELLKKINKTSKNEVLLFLIEKIAQLNEIKSSILNQGHIDLSASKNIINQELYSIEKKNKKLSKLIDKIILATEVSECDPLLFYLSKSPEEAIEKFKECAPDIEKWNQKIQQNQTSDLENTIKILIEKSCENILLDMQQNSLKLNNHISLYKNEKEKQDMKINKIEKRNKKIWVKFEEINQKITNIDNYCKNQQIEISSTQDRWHKWAYDNINDIHQLINQLKNDIENLNAMSQGGGNGISRSEYRNLRKKCEEALSKSEFEKVLTDKINDVKKQNDKKLEWESIESWWNGKLKEIYNEIDINYKKTQEAIMALHPDLEKLRLNFKKTEANIKLLNEKSNLIEKISKERSTDLKKLDGFSNEITKIKTELNNTINIPMAHRRDKQHAMGIANSKNYQERSLPTLNELNNYFNLWKRKEEWLEIYKSEINKTDKMKQDLENLKSSITKFMREYKFLPMPICNDVGEINEKIQNYNDFKVDLKRSYDKINSENNEGHELFELLKECEDLKNYQSSYNESYLSLENIDDDDINKFQKFISEHEKSMRLFIFELSSSIDENRVELLIYDIESKIQTKIPMADNSFPSSTSIVQIPDNRLFCFGFKFPDSKICCIIEENSKITYLQHSPIFREESSFIYYESCIYWFGGIDNNGSPLAVTEKFNLFEEKYSILPDMMLPAKRCSCLRYNNEILICGYEHDKIYRLSVQKDRPNEWASDNTKQLCANSDKILFSGNNQVFIFDMQVGSISKVMVNKDNFVLETIAENFILNFQSHPFRTYYKNSIYFGFSSEDKAHYFKFNLDSHSLEELEYEE